MAPVRILWQCILLILAQALLAQGQPRHNNHQHLHRRAAQPLPAREQAPGLDVRPFLPLASKAVVPVEFAAVTKAAAATTPRPAHATPTSAAATAEATATVAAAEAEAAAEVPPLVSSLGSTVTVSISTSVAKTGTIQILPKLSSNLRPDTTGSVQTSLQKTGGATLVPLITSVIPSPPSLLVPTTVPAVKLEVVAAPTTLATAKMASPGVDIFQGAIGTAIPAGMAVEQNHPVPRIGLGGQQAPIETNKFYANLFLGDQRSPAYTYPYALSWAGGGGVTGSWGMSISHVDASQRVFGPDKNGVASYYINPVGIQYVVISAKELGKDTALTVEAVTAFSAAACLRPSSGSSPAIVFPLVQGMSCVTARFSGATPVLQTAVFFRTVTKVTTDPKPDVAKFNLVLEDGSSWHVYAHRIQGSPLSLKVTNNGYAAAAGPFYGTVQVCKDPGGGAAQSMYDDGAGVYPTGLTLSGTASGVTGTYTFTYARAGHPQGDLAMYALPHHVASFDAGTRARLTTVRLQTPTKGVAAAVRGQTWTMVESQMPISMAFAPWCPQRGSVSRLSNAAKAAIAAVAEQEVSQNMMAQTDLDSMYFSGKALVKFGQILYVIQSLLGNRALAQAGLVQLKAAFARFVRFENKYPLVYEKAWGGVVSSASYATGDSGVDFGNTYYNDHHFHYGYHILAAAYIGMLDPSWVGPNRDYVNALVRDVANPSTDDRFFPTWRSFDWYHGHSWAHGLYASWDGKDQESSSEDSMHAYAIKMWGMVSGDAKMTARANLQLAVTARSLQSYYLLTQDNTIQPANYVGNRVAGILFENKADHTTYFDPNIEAVQGIHMIPVIAPSGYTRTAAFVQQEWDTYFSNGRIDGIQNIWKGIIYADYGLVNPRAAWEFFNGTGFQPAQLDGGASQTWYLAYVGALGGM